MSPASSSPVSQLNVLIAGMHRSGTSAVGQLLAGAGISRGRGEGEAQPKFDNPAGFAERQDVVDLDEGLLRTLGWTWDAPSPLPLAHVPDRPGLIKRGRTLVAANLDGPVPWFIKDPRLSLLLPWWRKILLDRFVVVVPWRPLDEIAWSLHLRDDLPLAVGVALSGAYLRHLAAGLQGLPVIVVDYPALTERPLEVVRDLLAALDGSGVRLDHDVQSAVKAVDPLLRRATVPPGLPLDALLSAETAALVAGWPDTSVEVIARFEMAVNEPAPWEVALLDLQRRLRTARDYSGRLQQEIAELRGRP